MTVDVTAGALLLGAALDLLLGDPRGWPHPVRAIGALISGSERALRGLTRRAGDGRWRLRIAGVVLALWVVGLTGGVVWSIVAVCDWLGGPAPLLGQTLLIYWGLAIRSLGAEALRASEAPDLPTARRELAMIVGRDTENLDWPEIRRACLETIGENVNDGVIAPLFWLALAGPVGLWTYKAVSTLDSMVGYRNERYRDLGWASARLDDLANLVPARLTWIVMALAALILGEHAGAALRIGWRDGRKHPSPNSAWGEATLAGALGVRLGGPSSYGGVPSVKPFLGDAGPPIDALAVRRAVRLLWGTALLGVILAGTIRVLGIDLA